VLAAMAGLLSEESGEQTGEVLVDGADARQRRDRIGFLFQDPQTQLVMARAGDDVAFGLENRGVPPHLIWPQVQEALRRVDFPYDLTRPTDQLSGGEQQRLALAGVLALRPSLLLADEPTALLDPSGSAVVREALHRAVADHDTTLVLVEHRVADVLSLINRVVVLAAGGGVAADGSPERVFRTYGEELAASGVWVPGYTPPRVERPDGGSGAPLLTATGLGYRHPGASQPVLSDVDIEVRAGEVLAITGENGSGKSTLALLLGGLLRPSTGVLHAGPALIAGHSRLARTPPHRWRAVDLTSRIGSVFQNPEHQFVTATVEDELALGPRRLKLPAAVVSQRVTELLERLRLTPLARANPYTLSGGEQRRLSVATALATAPRVLVLDEPTFGQDLKTWTELVLLCHRLRSEGTGLVVVTHDRPFADALADRAVSLHRRQPQVDTTVVKERP